MRPSVSGAAEHHQCAHAVAAEHHLQVARAVAQDDEDEALLRAQAVHPARDADLLVARADCRADLDLKRASVSSTVRTPAAHGPAHSPSCRRRRPAARRPWPLRGAGPRRRRAGGAPPPPRASRPSRASSPAAHTACAPSCCPTRRWAARQTAPHRWRGGACAARRRARAPAAQRRP